MTHISKSNKLTLVIRIAAALAMLVLIVQGLLLLPSSKVRATSYSWSSGSPGVVSSNTASSDLGFYPGFCSTQLQGFAVAGQSGMKNVCVIAKNGMVRLGTYFEGGFHYVVNFGYDTKMYQVGLPCEGPDGCLYLPETDTLATKQHLINGSVKSLVVYKNFTKRLVSTFNSSSLATEYSFDSSNSDYTLHSSATGYQWPVGGFGASDNGKWLAVEFRQRGFGLLNIDTFAMRRVSTRALSYGTGYDPNTELAVSNDGNYMAVAGMNVGLTIHDTPTSCGDAATDENMDSVTPIATNRQCPVAVVDHDEYIERFHDALRPSFNSNGGELTYYATSYSVPIRSVVLRVAGYTPPTMNYLALGDSYSSGEGDTVKNPATNQKYYRDYTDNEEDVTKTIPREKCHISTRSYPYLLAHGMGLNINNPKQWDSVACSGATTWDVKAQGSEDYAGQGDRLKDYSLSTLKDRALNDFIPGRQKQIEFVEKYKPKVITLTMGGNDIGFAEKIRSCLIPASCQITGNDGRSSLASQIKGQYDNLKSLYDELYKASGSKAKVYVLGYPQFINGDEDVSCPYNIGLLDADGRKTISNSVTYLNRVIKKAAEAAGVKYIDIENSLKGYKLCDTGSAYVTGMAAWGSSENQESFHPNAKGNAAIANSVWDENNVDGVSLLDYDICADSDLNACPDPTATEDSIDVPSYFQTSDPAVNSRYKEMVSEDGVKGAFVRVITGLYSLAVGSTAQLTLHSEPIDLGSYVVGETGQLDINVLIPTDVPAGYHTFIVTGTTYSGEPIQLEQTLLVQGSNPSDIDDNNISDSQQSCLFLPSSGVDADFDGIDDACDPEIGEELALLSNGSNSPTSTSKQSGKFSNDNMHNGDVSDYDNTKDVYTILSMTPTRNKLALLSQTSVNDSTNTLRKFVASNLFSIITFTTLLILTTISALVIKKQNRKRKA